jgi:hypothetical protein
MVKRALLIFLVFAGWKPVLQAQEVLMPLQTRPVATQAQKESGSQVLTLPFFCDFSAATRHWEAGGGAAESDGGGLLPPTVGVVTLDALDATGNLYPDASMSLFAADTLTSLPVCLEGLSAADSVVLSFYYLPGGGEGALWERVGDAPDPQDSLMLEFYCPADSMWVPVWSRGGVTVDSLVETTGHHWQYVAIPIVEPVYFDSLFRFRFRNFCSLTYNAKPGLMGNGDYWHLDYIVLDAHRRAESTPVFHDVAFVAPAPSALADYRAMPARQYTVSEMATHFDMTIDNLFNSTLATHYSYAIVDAEGDTLYRYDGGYENATPFLPGETYQTAAAHAHPSLPYSFPEMEGPAEYTIVHTVREGSGGDDYTCNDTVSFRQVFEDYYAYDDGSAENGYGLTSTSSHLYLAYRFDLNTADTLTALDLYFNRTYDGENERIPFIITVWKAEKGKPGAVLYRDNSRRRPLFDGLNSYQRYVLEHPVVVNDTIFVGFEQTNNYFINLGFDRSRNTSDRIYYLTSTEWQQSILGGSLMMRPYFGVAATVGIETPHPSPSTVHLFPNPASNHLKVNGLAEGSRVEIYDATGRKVTEMSGKGTMEMDVRGWAQGVYLLRCVTREGEVHTEKIIISH